MLDTAAPASNIVRPDARSLALVSAVEQISTAHDLPQIIDVVRRTARAVSGADGVAFVLREGERCRYVEEDAVGPLWKGLDFPLEACISGWCMLNGQVAAVPDIYEDERIPHEAYRPTFVKSLIMTPVGADGAVAAIGAYWATRRQFDPGEIALLAALARSTAAAIEAVKARDGLRENEERLRLALIAGRLGAWEFDLARGELVASALCKAAFGYAPEDAFGYPELTRAVHPDDLPAARAAFEQVSGRDVVQAFRVRRTDGEERWLEMRGRGFADGRERPTRAAGVLGDITEARRAEERVQSLQSDLARIGRMNELGQMSSSFAHELNQPLSAAANYMSGARRLLGGGANGLERATAAILKAEAQLARAGATIRRIRDFIGKGQAVQSTQDVGDLMREAVEIARIDPRHWDMQVRVETPPGLPGVSVDRVQVQQVLLNLVRNAFEAMEESPRKSVSLSAALCAGGTAVELRVADTGPGLACEVAERLFEPFLTTKAEGMGVGLSICRQIIEGHGGRMWHEPAAEGGAAFAFTLPVAAAEA